jgi:hypothetical protein
MADHEIVKNGHGNGHTVYRTAPVSTATKLRQKLLDTEGDIIACPGVYDGFSARIAINVGFEVLYMVSKNEHMQL